jgi:hypothetical protein
VGWQLLLITHGCDVLPPNFEQREHLEWIADIFWLPVLRL